VVLFDTSNLPSKDTLLFIILLEVAKVNLMLNLREKELVTLRQLSAKDILYHSNHKSWRLLCKHPYAGPIFSNLVEKNQLLIVRSEYVRCGSLCGLSELC